MATPKIFTTVSHSIFHNLSFEEVLLKHARVPVLFLYQNASSVIIGRNQNPWKEIHMDRLEADGVALCRRKSGGGAVYQDLGNTTFSFITPGNFETKYKQDNNEMILSALTRLGITAEVSGRNDILVNSKKVSGSAYKIVHSKEQTLFLHHGTMLINIDKEGAYRYLNPNKAKLQSKGVSSVTSRIINLTEVNSAITGDAFIDSLKHSFLERYPTATHEQIIDYPPEVEQLVEGYLDWEWRYGQSPQFTYAIENRFDWGIIDLNFNVVNGCIEEVKVFSDCLHHEFIDFLEEFLQNKPYSRTTLDQLLLQTPNPDWSHYISDVAEWLKDHV